MTARSPLAGYGIGVTVLAIALLLGGALAGLMGLGEIGRYASLTNAGNPFAGAAANSGVYLLGIAATAVLSGVALLVVGIAFQSRRVAAALAAKQ